VCRERVEGKSGLKGVLCRSHPLLTTEETQALVEQLNAGGERLILQPSSYIRPLGSDTTISINHGVSPPPPSPIPVLPPNHVYFLLPSYPML